MQPSPIKDARYCQLNHWQQVVSTCARQTGFLQIVERSLVVIYSELIEIIFGCVFSVCVYYYRWYNGWSQHGHKYIHMYFFSSDRVKEAFVDGCVSLCVVFKRTRTNRSPVSCEPCTVILFEINYTWPESPKNPLIIQNSCPKYKIETLGNFLDHLQRCRYYTGTRPLIKLIMLKYFLQSFKDSLFFK